MLDSTLAQLLAHMLELERQVVQLQAELERRPKAEPESNGQIAKEQEVAHGDWR